MTMNSNIKTKYSGIILAGGKSSRMGDNKALLKWNGVPFLRHAVFKIKQLGIKEIIVSGKADEECGVHCVRDVYHDRGPLGGLHACLGKIKTPYALVMPVDAPNIPLFVFEELIDYHQKLLAEDKLHNPVVLWEHGNRIEPLIGIYPAEMADQIGKLISDRPAPVFRMLDRWENVCYRIEIRDDMIVNINTRDNYRELKAMENE